MTATRIALASAVASLVAFPATLGATAAPAPTLRGAVGPGFTITLKQNGRRVTALRAGTYTFVIADRSRLHDFVIEREKGGRFEKELTTEAFTGTRTATIRLTRGEWKFYCEPHESVMSGVFRVT
jgi:plastocyanin